MAPEVHHFHVKGEFPSLSAARKFRDAVQKVLGDDSIVFLGPEQIELLDKFEEEAPTANPRRILSPQAKSLIQEVEAETDSLEAVADGSPSPKIPALPLTTKTEKPIRPRRRHKVSETETARDMRIADLLRETREERQLTQLQLSKLTGISRTSITNWENGKAIPFDFMLVPVIRALGLNMEDGVGETLLGLPSIIRADLRRARQSAQKRHSPRVEATKRELAQLEAIPYEELNFAQLLKKLRLQENMSRPALGAAAHVSAVTISGYENGSTSPRGDSLGRLINGLKIEQDGEVANRLRVLGYLAHVKRHNR